jgi:hypothetical protein
MHPGCARWSTGVVDSPIDLSCGGLGTAFALGEPMTIREFTDSAGTSWRVWATMPRAGVIYGEDLKSGWLTFESAGSRRRLAPIPRGWEEAPRDRLELMCRAAEVVRRASGSAPLTPDPDAPDSPEGDRPDAPEST